MFNEFCSMKATEHNFSGATEMTDKIEQLKEQMQSKDVNNFS